MPQDTGASRGLCSELTAKEAFLSLQRNPKYGLKYPIIEVVHAEKNGDMDKTKKDLEVTLKRGGQLIKLGIQIKSSYNNLRRHYRACRRLGVYIPVMVVSPGETLEMVMLKAVTLIERAMVYLFEIAKSKLLSKSTDTSARRHGTRFGNHRHWCPKPQRFAMVH